MDWETLRRGKKLCGPVFREVCRALAHLEFRAAEFDAAVAAEARGRRLSALDLLQLLPILPDLRDRAVEAPRGSPPLLSGI